MLQTPTMLKLLESVAAAPNTFNLLPDQYGGGMATNTEHSGAAP